MFGFVMDKNYSLSFTIAFALTFVITVVILHWLIPKLKSLKMGQTILDIGPRWHKGKEGTPTMGGLAFLIAMFLVSIAGVIFGFFVIENNQVIKFIITFVMALCYGFIGIWDDSLKIRKKENEGFKAWQKFSLQVVIAALYLLAMHFFAGLESTMYIPFVKVYLDMGIWYYILTGFIIVGIVNSVNLNDGIDGLCSSVTCVNGIFFAIAGFALLVRPIDGAAPYAVSLTSAMIIGGTLGFLVYNFYPAKIFMGDTGSLFLGGLVSGIGVLIGSPLIVLVVGIIYVIESLSDIIQVGVYKLTHKRVFKMAPIHHHFEKCGWSEVKIVIVFSIVTFVFAIISFIGLYI